MEEEGVLAVQEAMVGPGTEGCPCGIVHKNAPKRSFPAWIRQLCCWLSDAGSPHVSRIVGGKTRQQIDDRDQVDPYQALAALYNDQHVEVKDMGDLVVAFLAKLNACPDWLFAEGTRTPKVQFGVRAHPHVARLLFSLDSPPPREAQGKQTDQRLPTSE
jgi:hypothetical protein